jgi:glutamate dehydrogenase/leucine dehydrogenase
VCAPGDTSFFAEACDVFAPCALGAVLNPTTIPLLRARVVCGAANNQLDDAERDGQALRARGIAYVPDFLVNRMGIVNCANEQYGRVSPDPAMERHFSRDWPHSIYELTRVVMTRARTSGETEAQAAIRLADELAKVPHPIFPERSRQIIGALCR